MAEFTITSENAADVAAAVEAAKNPTPPPPAEGTPTPPAAPEAPLEGLEIKPADNKEIPPEEVPADLKLDEFFTEYAQKGSLSEESRTKILKALKKGGFDNPEIMLSRFESGAKAETQLLNQKAFAITGGEQGYRDMINWAAENLTPEEIQHYNTAAATPGMTELAVRGLFDKFRTTSGGSPRIPAGPNVFGGFEPITSFEQMSSLVSTDQYMKDPGHRKLIDQRIESSRRAGYLKL